MNIFLVVLLVLAGVALLVAELFLLPGFGIAGVSGLGCLIGAVLVAVSRKNRAGCFRASLRACGLGILAQPCTGQDGIGHQD